MCVEPCTCATAFDATARNNSSAVPPLALKTFKVRRRRGRRRRRVFLGTFQRSYDHVKATFVKIIPKLCSVSQAGWMTKVSVTFLDVPCMLRAVLPIFLPFHFPPRWGTGSIEHDDDDNLEKSSAASGAAASKEQERPREGGRDCCRAPRPPPAAVLSTHPSQPVEFRFRGSPACPPGRSGPSPPHGLASGFSPRPPSWLAVRRPRPAGPTTSRSA